MNTVALPVNSTRRRLMFALGALPFVSLAVHAKEAELPMLEAVNQAGRQRSFPQRIAKFYAQQLCGVKADEAGPLKLKAIELFEQQYRALTDFATRRNAKDILDTYAKMGRIWDSYKSVATGPVNLDGLKQIATMSEQLLDLAQLGTTQFAALSGTQFGKLVAMAGRDRMLSQRISKFYFLQAAGLQSAQIAAEIEAERKEFVANMQILKKSPENTKAIQSALGLAETQWLFFDMGLQSAKNSQDLANQRNNIAVASENIFQVMDQLVAAYTSLG